MKRHILAAFLIIQYSIAQAQPADREVVNQSTEWFSVVTNVKVNKILTVLTEGQFRYVQKFEPMQYQLRSALDFKINDHFSITPIGYVYTWNYKYGKQPAKFQNNEHRIWQQVSYKHSISRFKFDHRLRLEQRFIQVHTSDAENGVIDEGYDNKQNRIRYRFNGRVPLNKYAMEPQTLFLCFYDEVFFSWGKSVTFEKPDQNRVFTGLGYEFSKKFTLQGGFLYQMLIKGNGQKQENNVGFQMQVNYNLNLKDQ